MVPSQHIFVKKCEACCTLKSEASIIDGTIKRLRKQLEFNKTVHRVWPDSLDLMKEESGCSGRMITNRLIAKGLW